MIALYILITIVSILLLICLIILLFTLYVHNSYFGKRFTPNPNVVYYTKEEFELSFFPCEIKDGKDKLCGGLYTYDGAVEDKIIIFGHGMDSSVKAYIQDIEYLCRKGFQVFAVDYHGTDTSTGKSLKGLSYGIHSIDKAIKYVKDTFGDREIILMGHSWGAYSVLSALKYNNDISKVIAISPFMSLKSLLIGGFPKKIWPCIPFFYFVEWIKCGKYAFSNTVKGLKKFNGQALILHSKDDPVVKYDVNTLKLMDKIKNAKYMISLNKGHNPEYSFDAIKELNNYIKEINCLKTDDEKIAYMKKTDFHKLGELDNTVMDKIVEFINS